MSRLPSTRNADALNRLADIADLFLDHNRPIRVRCDDSVTRVIDGAPRCSLRQHRADAMHLSRSLFRWNVRRRSWPWAVSSKGLSRWAAAAMPLSAITSAISITMQLIRHSSKMVALYEELFAIKPRLLVHDLHPDYASTRYARERGEKDGLRLLAVQHHHAHMASCMAEHGLTEKVIGVSFDGTGYGTDGAIWGGEFLVGDCRQFRRAAHLRYVGMPGGEQAIREPWRMGGLLICWMRTKRMRCCLQAARIGRFVAHRWANVGAWPQYADDFECGAIVRRRGFAFGGRSRSGQLRRASGNRAGMSWRLERGNRRPLYPWDMTATPDGTLVVDTRPIIQAVAADVRQGVPEGRIARRFHTTMAELIVGVCRRLRQTSGLDAVLLSGGVFMNALLTHEACQSLRAAGFRVYRHQRVPPNDGGLSLGQLAVAAAQLPLAA